MVWVSNHAVSRAVWVLSESESRVDVYPTAVHTITIHISLLVILL